MFINRIISEVRLFLGLKSYEAQMVRKFDGELEDRYVVQLEDRSKKMIKVCNRRVETGYVGRDEAMTRSSTILWPK